MKGVLKVSKEQVIEIERYCDEHGITRKQRIDELGLSHTAYYYTRGLVLYMTVLERGERYTGKRTIDYSNLDVVENVIDPQEVLDATDDFASMEKLLPGGWKKSHPESHSMKHYPHDRGETRDRHPEVQGKEKGILQRPICVWPGSFV